MGRVIAVASGKGGVGKTWIAISLSQALRRRGERVLLFDADLGTANVDVQLGLVPGLTLAAVARGECRLHEAITRRGAAFDVLAGASGSGALAALAPDRRDAVLADLPAVADGYDRVLIDAGAGLDATVRQVCALADLLLLVLVDEPTSLTDAYALLKLRHALDPQSLGQALVVVNQAASRGDGERTFARLSRACTGFLGATPRLAGIVRRDEHVRDAIRRQATLLDRHPLCAAAADIETLAAWLQTDAHAR